MMDKPRYTGCWDKHGTAIREGDLLECESLTAQPWMGRVVWKGAKFIVIWKQGGCYPIRDLETQDGCIVIQAKFTKHQHRED